jgi:hypothetical protein
MIVRSRKNLWEVQAAGQSASSALGEQAKGLYRPSLMITRAMDQSSMLFTQ